MRSIFLIKSNFAKTALIIALSCFLNISCSLGQVLELAPLNKIETRSFLENLIRKYGQSLTIYNDKQLTKSDAYFYDALNNKYDLKIQIDDSIITFSSIKIGTSINESIKNNSFFEILPNLLDAKQISDKKKLENRDNSQIQVEQTRQILDSLEKSKNEINDKIVKYLKEIANSENAKTILKNYEIYAPANLFIELDKLIFEENQTIDNDTSKLSIETKNLKNTIKIIDEKNEQLKNYYVDFAKVVVNQKTLKKNYNYLLRLYQRPNRGFAAISGSANLSYRMLSATSRVTNSTEIIDERNQNEYMLPNSSLGVKLGLARYSHHFSLTYSQQSFGVNFDNDKLISPTTGYYDSDITKYKTSQSSITNLWGIQYEYSKYWKKWSPYFQFGINVIFDNKEEKNFYKHPNSYFGTAIKSGIGLSYKPCYHAEFHISPTGLIFLNSKDANYINTRFFSIGLEVGAHLYFNNCLPKAQ